ncbi:MAG: hypothetical protein Q7T18_11475 [Sedimentisphaerales bacterium]|nr:hypothetical protein [Sedimentisphaerales bacterium]
MKNRIASKIFLLVVLVSMMGLCIIGCERIEAKKSLAAIREDAVTSYVNLPNPNGSVTPVLIKRQGNVYIGPRGEQYTSYPTVEQLQPVYGMK